jgi:probable HAF family extracellular repeat protein
MKGKLVMKNRDITFMSNAKQSNLANNHSESERSQIMRQMTMFAQRVCSMLGGAFFVGAFVLTLVAIPSGASAFTFTTIDPPGATQTFAGGINDRGQTVGAYFDVSGTEHGFLLDEGTFTTIDDPGAKGSTEAAGINELGQIVGEYTDAGGTIHGFLLDKGSFITIECPRRHVDRGRHDQ